MTKRCRACSLDLSLDKFGVNRRHKDGLQPRCKDCMRPGLQKNEKRRSEESKAQRRAHRNALHASNPEPSRAKAREAHRRLREEAIQSYGGSCECCGESTFEFLAIDHARGDGAEHRFKINENIYPWLKKNGYPKDGRFRILCHNCNCGRERNGGVCPHEQERQRGLA